MCIQNAELKNKQTKKTFPILQKLGRPSLDYPVSHPPNGMGEDREASEVVYFLNRERQEIMTTTNVTDIVLTFF